MKTNHNLLDTQQAINFLKENHYHVETLAPDSYRVTIQGGTQQVYDGRRLVEFWRECLRRKHLLQDSTQKKTAHYELLEERFISQEILDATTPDEYHK